MYRNALVIAVPALFLTLVCGALFVSYLLGPEIIVTSGLSDTLFLLNTAYFMSEGLQPHQDFPHFYGGGLTYVTALWFRMTDSAPASLDLSINTFFAIASIMLLVLLAKSKQLIPGFFAAFLLAAIFATRTPFESSEMDVLKHSFTMSYNRMGWGFVLTAVLSVYFWKMHRSSSLIYPVVFGLSIFFVAWIKSTFGVVIAGLYIYVIVLGGFAFLLKTTIVFVALLGVAGLLGVFGPLDFIKSVVFFLEIATGLSDQKFNPLNKVIWSGTALIVPAMLLSVEWFRNRHLLKETGTSSLALIFLIFVLLFATSLTTGSFKIETVRSPVIAVVALLMLYELSQSGQTMRSFLSRGAIALLLCLAFSLSNLASGSIYALKKVAQTRNAPATTVMSPVGWVIIDNVRSPLGNTVEDVLQNAAFISGTDAKIDASDGLSLYASMVDGTRLAQSHGVQPGDTLVSLSTSYFPYLVGSTPVGTFPTYSHLGWHAQDGFTLDEGIDYVLVPGAIGNSLLAKSYAMAIEQNYEEVARSTFWTLYHRR